MALDNMFREPRREIIESVAGILFAIAVVYADYGFGSWFESKLPPNSDHFVGVMAGMVLGAVGVVILWILAHITHWIGEGICGFLARRGLELRPKQRY